MNLPRPIYCSCLISVLLTGTTYSFGQSEHAAASVSIRRVQDEPREFRIPASDASDSLAVFSLQAGTALLYVIDDVRGVRTPGIEGRLAPREALERLLSGTVLQVTEDPRTGALLVKRTAPREPAPKAVPAFQSEPNMNPPPPMQTSPTSLHRGWFAALLAVLAAPALPAQTATPPPKEEPVLLSPFEVQEDKSNSYSTLNSNSITRFNTELGKMPLSADIFDQAFMNDVGATSVEDMLMTYSAGVGFSGNDPGAAAAASPGDHVGHSGIQLRGFTSSYLERDALMPVGSFFSPGSTGSNFTSNFDVERAEVINGPQSLLYSGGGGGGVINVTSKQARFAQPASGSLMYRVDQYGSKISQLDLGVGTQNVALRFAMIGEAQNTRRINIGGSLEGYYLQVAARFFHNTTVRLLGEQTTYNQILSRSGTTLSAGSTAQDSRQGDTLAYLLATNQAGANTLNAAGQPNASGAIDNGQLNWANVDSYGGNTQSNLTINTFTLMTADTTWTPWLSTQLSAGYDDFYYDLATASLSFYAPQSTSNPLGVWAAGVTPGDLAEPGRSKAIRFVALATNDLFGGKAHSQTIVGGDFLRQDGAQFTYAWLQADSNFNATVNPATIATIGGRTLLPKQYWSIANGFAPYPFFGPRSPRITIGGVNYVRQLENIVNPALISPANPLGTIGTTGTYEIAKAFNQGWFATNNTQWLDGKLDTLVGVRLANFFTQSQTASTADSSRRSDTTNINVGANYTLLSWLRAYATVANTTYPPEEKGNTVIGEPTPTAKALAEEVGLKWNTSDGRYSGSLSIYHDAGKNEQLSVSSTIESDINPAGLNGRYGTSPAAWVYVDRTATGVSLLLTANPTPNWRLRFNASDVGGVIGTTTSYNQLYNDQFNENGSGQVTYADGTVVYVPATFNSKSPTTSAATAGAVPLTVTMMNTPTSVYYANPVNPSGAISTSSAVFTVLQSVDPIHGAIATGKTGLPISSIQISPQFALPGRINVTQKGDHTFGYPQLSSNMTSIYTFPGGWLKGLEVGGTLAWQAKYAEYYYYPLGVAASLQRNVYSLPGGGRADLILGYTHKFRRVTWRTQLNVANLTNHYSIIVLPNETTGWSSVNAITARYSQNPRSYSWTNTFSF